MKVELEDFDPMNHKQSGFDAGDRFYPLAELIKACEDQKAKPFKACLNSMAHQQRWTKINSIDFAEHYKRVEKSTLEHPIIMNYDGYILDGFHRVVKALLLGEKHIKAVKIDLGEIKEAK